MKSLLHLVRTSAILFICLAAHIFVDAQVNVTTYHNDVARTGQNTQETTLTTANVKGSSFGPLFSVGVDGQVYAQPLVLSNLSIGGGTHNVVYVATENDSVYAIDAETGAVYWWKSLGSPVPSSELPNGGCGNISPYYGITSTPTINPTTGTLYVVTSILQNEEPAYQLHALAVATGAEKFAGPVAIGGSYDGVTFNAAYQHIRPGLLLENGHLIIASGSHCDNGPWYGWVMSYNASTLLQEAIFNVQPNGGSAGIWMSGNGVAADGSGNLYFATGNGDEYLDPNYGNSILKLSAPTPSGFSVVDYFTPSASNLEGNEDNDVGSGGVLLIPGTSRLVGMGKEGVLYLVNTTTGDMGKYCGYSNCVDNIVQEIQGASVGVWGSPAYWNGHLYYGSAHENGPTGPVEAFSFNATGNPELTGPTSKSPEVFAWPTPAPSVSSNGTSNGIVWVLDNSGASSCCQVLHAYNAANLSIELYSVSLPFGPIKFSVPAVANGEVFVGSNGTLTAFALTSGPTNTVSPTSLTFAEGHNCISGPEDVTLTNTGSVWMSFNTAVASGTGFSASFGTCSTNSNLNPGQSCTVEVTYVGGTSNVGKLYLYDSGAGSPKTVTLNGITLGHICQ